MTGVCMIRWPLWYNTDPASNEVLRSISNPKYQTRAPFWATKIDRTTLRMDPTTATMAVEIAKAAAAKVSWAWLRYAQGSPLNAGFDMYMAHANRASIKFSVIMQSSILGSTGNYATQVAQIVGWMGQLNYRKVLSTRPLMALFYNAADLTTYWGGSSANLKAAIDAVRAGAISAGLANPYIVLMDEPGVNPTANATALGIDAVSSYITSSNARRGATYAELSTAAQAFWAAQLALGLKVVPTGMLGWDRRPRIERPVQWELGSQLPMLGLDNFHAQPSNAELVAHLTALRDYVVAHPSACEADVGYCYAWDEFDEGGWLCPTRNSDGTMNSGRVDALATANIFTA